MDRNTWVLLFLAYSIASLSARRAWIEIFGGACARPLAAVALRKESVDRNYMGVTVLGIQHKVALRKESVDRNDAVQIVVVVVYGRSPQGERG